MQEIITYDSEDIADLLRVLRIVLSQINRVDIYRRTSDEYLTNIISLKRLIRYEKSSRFYTLYFSKRVKVMDSRTARKMLNNDNTPGFISINRRDVINLNYLVSLEREGLYVMGEDKPLVVSRSRRRELENSLNK